MFHIAATEAGTESFQLLELSVGGKGARGSANEGVVEGQSTVLLSVRGDGRVAIDGGGGVIIKDGDLEVSQGDAAFKVWRAALRHEWYRTYRGAHFVAVKWKRGTGSKRCR